MKDISTRYISDAEILLEEFGIKSIEINGQISILDNSSIPSKDELDLARQNYLKKINSSLYKEQRYNEYPKIVDQLDMLYHDIKNNNISDGTWINAIDSIKLKYPKQQDD